MRFSDNRFCIEKYVKCANCGMLVYGKGIEKELSGITHLYCSDWCLEWARLRATHDGYFRLPIVQPKLPSELAKQPSSAQNRSGHGPYRLTGRAEGPSRVD